MKERGILFSAPMVRALLNGSKTQTRRIVKLPHANPLGQWEPTSIGGPKGGRTSKGETIPEQSAIWHTRTGDCIVCPYGKPGDRLWVRETFAYCQLGSDMDGDYHSSSIPASKYERDCPSLNSFHIAYRADDDGEDIIGSWTPSIHMPRWASRITLEVISVRVERLNDISDTECVREGITAAECTEAKGWKNAYRKLWESINGAGSWDLNPWVWVIEFRAQEKP